MIKIDQSWVDKNKFRNARRRSVPAGPFDPVRPLPSWDGVKTVVNPYRRIDERDSCCNQISFNFYLRLVILQV